MSELSAEFNIKGMGPLKHFVGCHIIENETKDTVWIHQPKLLADLKQKFGKQVAGERVFNTPAAPRTMIMRPQEGDKLISPEMQTIFRSGVGMLLCLVKHSRPEISNAVRELTKVVDGATPGHWKAMNRAIKYVIDTENFKIETKQEERVVLFGRNLRQ